MNIPSFFRYVWTTKDGRLTEDAALYHDDLNQTLQAGLSDDGWTLPQITFANIQSIADEMPIGTLWWDTDNSRIVVKQSSDPTVLHSIDTTLIP